jgi:plasmid stabilization system protein ParE
MRSMALAFTSDGPGPAVLRGIGEWWLDRYIVVYPVRRDRVLIVRVWHGAQKR